MSGIDDNNEDIEIDLNEESNDDVNDLLEPGSADDGKTDGASSEGDEGDEGKISRKERRRQRAQRFKDRRRAEQEERDRKHQEELSRRDQQIAMLAGQVQAIQANQNPELQQETEVDRISREMRLMQEKYAARNDWAPEEAKQMRDDYNSLQIQQYRAIAREEQSHHQQPQADPSEYAARVRAEAIRQEYSDLFQNENIRRVTSLRYEEAVAKGAARNESTFKRVADGVRNEFFGDRKAGGRGIDESASVKYGDRTHGASGGHAPIPNKVTLNKQERRMADAAYPHIDDQKARYRLFARRKLEASKAG